MRYFLQRDFQVENPCSLFKLQHHVYEVPVKHNPVKVEGFHIGSCCYLTGFHLMDNSTQLVDTNQHIAFDSHPNVVSRSLKMREKHDR